MQTAMATTTATATHKKILSYKFIVIEMKEIKSVNKQQVKVLSIYQQF